MGATAVVVAMIDAGLFPGGGVQVTSPIGALSAFSSDPAGRETVLCPDGSRKSALDIQRAYLQMAGDNVTHPAMPAWTAKVCERWRRVLDQIENQDAELYTTLDWAIKLSMFREHIEGRGVGWSDLPAWTHVLDEIRLALKKTKQKGITRVERILGKSRRKSPIPDTIRDLTPYLEEHGLDWDMLRPVVDLRKELFELDFRYGQLGRAGIFNRLDAAGVLTHRMPGVTRIGAAVCSAPRTGRAALRARRIRRYNGDEAIHCNWTGIWDLRHHRQMDMTDPFATRTGWVNDPPLRRPDSPDRDMSPEQLQDERDRHIQRLRLRRRLLGMRDMFEGEDTGERP
jgi:hypothetical protein